MGRKLYHLLYAEISPIHGGQIITQGILYYILMWLCLTLFNWQQGAPLSQVQFLYLLIIFNLLILLSLIPSYFTDDLAENYLVWFRQSDTTLRLYFVAKLLGAWIQFALPLLGASLVLIKMLNLTIPLFPFCASTILFYSTTLCWGSLLQLIMGSPQNHSLQGTLLTLLIIPILMPLFFVTWECINALAQGSHWAYYLGMQSGLFLTSVAVGLGIVPLAVQHQEG